MVSGLASGGPAGTPAPWRDGHEAPPDRSRAQKDELDDRHGWTILKSILNIKTFLHLF
jgi:hypothetical protein